VVTLGGLGIHVPPQAATGDQVRMDPVAACAPPGVCVSSFTHTPHTSSGAQGGWNAEEGVTTLVCGAGQQGTMQVMATGELQYCGGDVPPRSHAGVPTARRIAPTQRAVKVYLDAWTVGRARD
jgi:hypothetical protein